MKNVLNLADKFITTDSLYRMLSLLKGEPDEGSD